MERAGLLLVAITFLIALTLYYLFFGIRYKKSQKFTGRVIDSKDTEIVHFARGLDDIYETYEVKYEYKGKIRKGEVCTSDKGLRPGAKIDVYVYDPDGHHEIQSDISWKHFETLAMALSFMLVMAILALIFVWGIQKINESNKESLDKIIEGPNKYEIDEEFMKNNKATIDYLEEKYGVELDTAD